MTCSYLEDTQGLAGCCQGWGQVHGCLSTVCHLVLQRIVAATVGPSAALRPPRLLLHSHGSGVVVPWVAVDSRSQGLPVWAEGMWGVGEGPRVRWQVVREGRGSRAFEASGLRCWLHSEEVREELLLPRLDVSREVDGGLMLTHVPQLPRPCSGS